jgi:hypothetical protein
VNWIHLAQLRIQQWALVNLAMNLGFVKGRDFFNQLSDYQLFKKDSSP